MEKKIVATRRIVTAYVSDENEIFPGPGLCFSVRSIDNERFGRVLQSKRQGRALIREYRRELRKMVHGLVDDARKELDKSFTEIEKDKNN